MDIAEDFSAQGIDEANLLMDQSGIGSVNDTSQNDGTFKDASG